MKFRKTRTVRLAVLAVSAGAVGTGAIGAGQAHAASVIKHPKVKHGVLTITGSEQRDKIALRLQAGNPGILQVDVGDDGAADFHFKVSKISKIAVYAGGGDDLVRIDETNGAFNGSVPTTIDGGAGRDTLLGGTGAETLIGGDGRDLVDGNGGNDLALLGAGNDTFVWDPGDGSDTIDGQTGADTMRFNGAGMAEHVDLSANGKHLRFFRDLGNITMDTAGVERVDFNALGGADVVTVNDLSATDVNDVNVDLAGALGGATGDGAADQVVVNATNGEDAINVNGEADELKVSGLAATTVVRHSDGAGDRLDVNTLAGRDAVDSAGLTAGAIRLFVDGVAVK